MLPWVGLLLTTTLPCVGLGTGAQRAVGGKGGRARDEPATHTANHRPPIPPNRLKTILEAAAIPRQPPTLVLLLFRVAPTATPEIQAPCTRHRCSAPEPAGSLKISPARVDRSEERRVGKESRYRW